MSDLASPLTVDADGHVLEPVDTWERYIDPAFRDRALRVGIDDDGFENLFIDGRPTMMLKGRLGALGGIEAEGDEKLALQTPGNRTYAEGAPEGGYDPAARLAVLDAEGIDQVLLYPTIGIAWEGSVRDPELATAYARAYNRWIVDFCSAAPKRLFPVAHISLIDEVGAVGPLSTIASIVLSVGIRACPLEVNDVVFPQDHVVGHEIVFHGRVRLHNVAALAPHVQVDDLSSGGEIVWGGFDRKHV